MADEKHTDSSVDEGTLEELYLPRLHSGPNIAHYYGDSVRMLFLIVAMIIFISIPLLNAFNAFLPVQILFAIVLIGLAAFTNPKNKMIMMASAGASALGVVLYETSALLSYRGGDVLGFIAYEILAFMFIFSLYFSLKTVRAMELGQIGKRDMPGEFMKEKYREARSLPGN